MEKPYCVLITRKQNEYINYLSKKLEVSRSCAMNMLIESYGLFSVTENGELIFDKNKVTYFYKLEYQRKRKDLVYRLKVYTNKIVIGKASQYMRAIIRYAISVDKQYVKDSQTD